MVVMKWSMFAPLAHIEWKPYLSILQHKHGTEISSTQEKIMILVCAFYYIQVAYWQLNVDKFFRVQLKKWMSFCTLESPLSLDKLFQFYFLSLSTNTNSAYLKIAQDIYCTSVASQRYLCVLWWYTSICWGICDMFHFCKSSHTHLKECSLLSYTQTS